KTDRQRGRFRLRLGIETKPNDKILAAVGIASGKTADPRSTNQTFQDAFDKKPVILDYAYVQYSPKPWVNLIGGKMKNPLWEPGDLIWDTDITPEGGSLNFSKKLNSKTALFLNTGVFVIDENNSGSGDDDDPILYTVQPGIEYAATDTVKLKAAFSYYNFSNVKGRTLDYGSGTNSAVGGKLINDYAAFIPAAEISITEPLKPLSQFLPSFLEIPYFAIFAEYVVNPLKKNDLSDSATIIRYDGRNTGYMLGFKLGAAKIEKWGDWQFKYNYAKLSKDAIPDILPDSDRYGGKTGIKAHEAVLEYGLGKNTWLSIDYYYAEQLKGNFRSTQSKPASVVQVDWNLKW
ncbi:MAG: putative porin, partial [Candidatus Omnitrophica bacterium]|nr:putative porin [Candidatus Omnitrophota bacterium]